VQWSEFIWFIPTAVQAVMLQSTAPLWAEGRFNELTAMLSRLLRYVALGTAFLLTVVVIFANQILEIYYGPEFREASLALRILAPGVFSFSLARVMWPVIQARGKVLTLVAVMAVVVLVNLCLNWFLIPTWGAVGAAMASSVSYGSVIFAYLWVLHRDGIQPLNSLAGSRLLILCLVSGGVAAPIAMFIPSSLVALIMGSLVVAGIYGLGIIRLGLIQVSEIQHIINSLPGPLHKHSVNMFGVLQPMLLRLEVSAPGKL
jgi:O-antigen/teichoic acid export membrane protein